MGFYKLKLVLRELARFKYNALRNRYLSDVMQRRRPSYLFDFLWRKFIFGIKSHDGFAETQRKLADSFDMLS